MATENHHDRRPQRAGLLEELQSNRPAHQVASLDVAPMRIVDREEDLAAICPLLRADRVRLLTLTGPAGVGKSRLAREVGRTLAPHFPDGVAFIDLAAVREPALVLPTVGQHLGMFDTGSSAFIERLQEYLCGREMLLILDNLEQVLPADIGLEDLVAAAPRLVLLATSREPLHLLAEQLYHVPPLALPDPEHLPALDELTHIPSIALFLQRARMIDPGFRLTDENAPAIAELVVHLDGLPLAIKLAAARTRVLSPQMLLERLSRRLSLLHWEAQDLPERQQTLRAAIAWSYDHLSADEQVLFRCLGVFVGGFSLEAVEAVVGRGGIEALDVLEGLGSLVDKSLVQREDDGRGGYRFRLLESVRGFALEQGTIHNETVAIGRAHALYYLARAEEAEPELTGSEQRTWYLRLEEMQDNLRAALEWFLDRDEGEQALRLAVALGHFWEVRGHATEGRRWLEAALTRAPAAVPALRARALIWLGVMLVTRPDQTGVGGIEPARYAEAVVTDGMDLARTVGDTVSIARALTCLGTLSLHTGEWDRGVRFLGEAQAAWQEAGHEGEVIRVVMTLGVIAFIQGRHDEALRHMDEVESRYRDTGDDWARGGALIISMSVIGMRGEVPRALALGHQLLDLSMQSQSGRLQYLSAVGTAWLLRSCGQPQRLAHLVGAALSMYEATGLVGRVALRLYVAPTMEVLQTRMKGEELDAAVRAGRHLSFPQVAALIQDVLQEAVAEATHPESKRSRNHAGPLSPREHGILQLVAEGLSNKEIARDLIIAESTVRYHLTSIFNKLGVDTRAHAISVAAQRGLIQLGQER